MNFLYGEHKDGYKKAASFWRLFYNSYLIKNYFPAIASRAFLMPPGALMIAVKP